MKIKAIQIIHPKDKVDNLSLFQNEIPDIQKFIDTTGIKERYIASTHHHIEDYFVQGIKGLPIAQQEIDVIITVTQTPSKLIPSISNYLQQQLPLRKDVTTYDLTSGCSGYTEALVLANQIFQLNKATNIIICNGDFSNHIIDENNYTIRPLFSDIAAITWLGNDTNDFLFESNHQSYGDGYQSINSENGCMIMNGLEVYQYSTQYVAESIKALFAKSNKDKNEIDGFYFHQANLIINKTITRQLQLDAEKVPFSIYDFGNSSSASIPVTLALKPILDKERITLLLSGFGVGFRICNILMETTIFESNIVAFED